MIESEENSFMAVSQTYKIWKKHSPFLYNILQVYELATCSQSVQWFNQESIENDWKIKQVLVGTNSLIQNALLILSVGLPTDDSLTDFSAYREEKPQTIPGRVGHSGTMGIQNTVVKQSIPQSSQIMKARINHLNESLIAMKTGGYNPEYIVYDLRNQEEQIQHNSVKLQGHSEEGFGLNWHPSSESLLLSGSYDKQILLHDIVSGPTASQKWSTSQAVQDVKWSAFNPKMFASAHQNQKINLWDTRDTIGKPAISRKAHSGQVYTVDFNRQSEFLLLSGGQDSDVLLWDIRNMSKKIHAFVGHNEGVNVVAWNPNSSTQFVSGSSDRRMVVWDIQKLSLNTKQKGGNQILFIHGGHRSKLTDCSWSKQGYMASCQENNILQVWKMNDRITQEE